MGFYIKRVIALIFHFCGITGILMRLERKRHGIQYIRVINYHDTEAVNVLNFRKQMLYLKKHYQNVNFSDFENFMLRGTLAGDLPGIMITFDDGLSGNYEHAKTVLEEHGMTGYFMVSADLVGRKGYMTAEQLKELVSRGHVIGCHTGTHHRMCVNDSSSVLEYEIVHAKRKLEEMLGISVPIFCWCGGEEHTYTREAQEYVLKAGYQYGFMTNSSPVTSTTDRFHIQRSNVEDSWPISLLKFQICGIMDYRFRKKRSRVNRLTQI